MKNNRKTPKFLPKPRLARPRLECLEDRTLLAGNAVAFFVNGYGGAAVPPDVMWHLNNLFIEAAEAKVIRKFDIYQTNWNSPDPTSFVYSSWQEGSTEIKSGGVISGKPGSPPENLLEFDRSLILQSPVVASLVGRLDPHAPSPALPNQFITNLTNILNTKYDDEDFVVLVGHSLGGNSVLRVAEQTGREIDLLATFDPVGWSKTGALSPTNVELIPPQTVDVPDWLGGGSLTVFPGLSVPVPVNAFASMFTTAMFDPARGLPGYRNELPSPGSNVRYFYNRWQTNHPFPFDYESSGLLNASRVQHSVEAFSYNGAPIRAQEAANDYRDASGNLVLHYPNGMHTVDVLWGYSHPEVKLNVDFGSITKPKMPPTVYASIGYSKTSRMLHGELPLDDYLQGELNAILSGIVPARPVANAGTDQSVNEGDTVTLNGSAYSTIPGARLEYQWVQTSGRAVSLQGANTLNPTFVAPDNGDYVFKLTVKDLTTNVVSDWADPRNRVTVRVNNLPPVVSPPTGPGTGVRGITQQFSVAFTDPGPLDTFKGSWDFGDNRGAPLRTVSSPDPVSHIFSASGTFQVTATIQDNGGASSSASTQITITAAGLIPDPLDPSKTALAVGGTAGSDHIVLRRGLAAGQVRVIINGTDEGTFSPTGRILVNGLDGDDKLTLDYSAGDFVTAAGLVWDGGAGNNTLAGSTQSATWTVTGQNQGNVSGGITFVNTQNLSGGTGTDTFTLTPAGGVSGMIHGGGQAGDALDYSLWITPVSINLQAQTATATGGVTAFGRLIGGSGNDFLQGGSGSYFIDGRGGSDTINGGTGSHATIYGGSGGGNHITGSKGGLNLIYGGGPADTIRGGNGGNDTIHASSGGSTGANTHNVVYGGAGGGNVIYGGGGGDRLYGVGGNNTLYGGSGGQTLYGGNGEGLQLNPLTRALYNPAGDGSSFGNNLLIAGSGNDVLYGNSRGQNTLIAGTGNDTLYAGSGDDFLVAGPGNDALYGGPGNNTFHLPFTPAGLAPSEDTIVGGAGINKVLIPAYAATPGIPAPPTRLLSAVTDTGSTSTITVASAADISVGSLILVGQEKMAVTAVAGNVLTVTRGVYGTSRTTHPAGAPVAILPQPYGTASGNYRVYFTHVAGTTNQYQATLSNLDSGEPIGQLNVVVPPDVAHVALEGGPGDNWIQVAPTVTRGMQLYGGPGRNTLMAGSGNDTLVAGTGTGVLYGGSGDCVLYGGNRPGLASGPGVQEGPNTLIAGSGNSQLFAGSGGDVLIGGSVAREVGPDGTPGLAIRPNGLYQLVAGAGRTVLTGGSGDDLLIAGPGGPGAMLVAGSGNEILVAANFGSNVLVGGPGPTNLLLGGNLTNVIIGGSGRNTLVGGLGLDTLLAGPGEDVLYASYNADAWSRAAEAAAARGVHLVPPSRFQGDQRRQAIQQLLEAQAAGHNVQAELRTALIPEFEYVADQQNTLNKQILVLLQTPNLSPDQQQQLLKLLNDAQLVNQQMIAILADLGANRMVDSLLGGGGNDTFYGNPFTPTFMGGGTGIQTFYNYNGNDTILGSGRGDPTRDPSNTIVFQLDGTINLQPILVNGQQNAVFVQAVTQTANLAGNTISGLPSIAGLSPGQSVVDSQGLLPAGTMIYSVNLDGTITLSNNASASATGVAFTIGWIVGNAAGLTTSNNVGVARITGINTVAVRLGSGNNTLTAGNFQAAGLGLYVQSGSGDNVVDASAFLGPQTLLGGSGNDVIRIAADIARQSLIQGGTGTSELNILVPDGGNVSVTNGVLQVGGFINQTLQTGTLTNGSNSVTGLAGVNGISVGAAVTGTGILPGTTVASIDSATAITLSRNATASGSTALTFSPGHGGFHKLVVVGNEGDNTFTVDGSIPNIILKGGSGTNSFTLQGPGNYTVVGGSGTNALTVKGSNNGGTIQLAQNGTYSAMVNGTVAWYKADGDASDSGGGGLDGTSSGNVSFVRGVVGQAFSFGGNANDFVRVPAAPALEPASTVTIEAWVKAPSPSQQDKYLVTKAAGAAGQSYALYTSSAGVRFMVRTATVTATVLTFSPAASNAIWDNTWHHLVGTYDGTTVRLYVDGLEVGTGSPVSGDRAIVYSEPGTINDLFIGNYREGSSAGFAGQIDEVRLYSRALSSSEARTLYNQGTSANPGDAGNLSGARQITVSGTINATATNITSVTLVGGNGNDLLDASGMLMPVVIDGVSGADTLRGGMASDTLYYSGKGVYDGGGGSDNRLVYRAAATDRVTVFAKAFQVHGTFHEIGTTSAIESYAVESPAGTSPTVKLARSQDILPTWIAVAPQTGPNHYFMQVLDGRTGALLSTVDTGLRLPITTAVANYGGSQIVVTAGRHDGGVLVVRGWTLGGGLLYSIQPNQSFGNVSIATGDLNGDGYDDIVVAPQTGPSYFIQVFDGRTGDLMTDLDTGTLTPISVAVADHNGSKVIVTAGRHDGGVLDVRGWNLGGGLLFNLQPNQSFGNVSIAAGDLNGDGYDDIVVAPRTGPSYFIQVFDGRTRNALNNRLDTGTLTPINVAVTDRNGSPVIVTVGRVDSGLLQVQLWDVSGGVIARYNTVNQSFGNVSVGATYRDWRYYMYGVYAGTFLTGNPSAVVYARPVAVTSIATSQAPGSAAVTLNVSFKAPGSSASNKTARISWGDGTTSTATVTGSSGNFSVTTSHLYPANATYTIHVSVIDGGGYADSASTTFSGGLAVMDGELVSVFGTGSTVIDSGPSGVKGYAVRPADARIFSLHNNGNLYAVTGAGPILVDDDVQFIAVGPNGTLYVLRNDGSLYTAPSGPAVFDVPVNYVQELVQDATGNLYKLADGILSVLRAGSPWTSLLTDVVSLSLAAGGLAVNVVQRNGKAWRYSGITPTFAGGPRFSFTVPATLTAGQAAALTLDVIDAFGNRLAGYTGTVQLASSDSAAVAAGGPLPSHTFTPDDNGSFTFITTFLTAGPQLITVSDGGGNSGAVGVTVAPGAASLFSLDAPPVEAGTPVPVTVTAYDAHGNVATGYTGTVRLSSKGVQADYAFAADNRGIMTQDLTFSAAGGLTMVATDAGGNTGTGGVVILAGPVDLAESTVSAPTVVVAGSSMVVTLTVRDTAKNQKNTSGLPVVFTLDPSSTAGGTFSAPVDHRDGTYSALFTSNGSAGSVTIVGNIAADGVFQSLTSSPVPVTVIAGPTDSARSILAVTPNTIVANTPATVTFSAVDAFGNAQPDGLSIGFSTDTNMGGGSFGPVTYVGGGTYAATFTALEVGSYTISVTLDGQDVTARPATVIVTSAPVSLSRSTAAVSATTVQGGGTVLVTLTAVDTYGNAESGDLSVGLGLRAGSLAGTFGPLVNQGNGVYSATFTPTSAGTDTILVTVNGQPLASAAPTVSVPISPVGSVATPTPTFSWPANANADHYTLTITDRTTGRVALTLSRITTAVYTLTEAQALTPGRSYTWSVTAVSTFFNARVASGRYDFTVAAMAKPTLSGPSGTLITDRPTFAWAAPPGGGQTDPGSYTLTVRDRSTGAVLTVAKLTDTSYTLTAAQALTPGRSYIWSVAAVSSNGKARVASGGVVFTIAAMAKPTLSGPSGTLMTDRPTFTWAAPPGGGQTGPGSYTLTVRDRSTGATLTVPNLSDTSYTLTAAQALTPGRSYIWSVAAVSSNGKAIIRSTSQAFTVAPLTAPVLASVLGETFFWQPVPLADRYALEIRDGTTGALVVSVPSVTGSSYTLTTAEASLLKAGHTYTWRVAAISTNGKVVVRSRVQELTVPE